ncbi:MAG: hypothetical protein JW932_00285 [Deltaproteobacteria bacterium]|nr:hypothetical protein [Deltaproteobacteria bacterium]
MASYDKAIPPGGEGKITLTVDTRGYERNIYKTADVYTNDPKMPRFRLGVRAYIEVPISVSPSYVNLQGNADQEISRTIKITAGLEEPLIIEPDRFNLEDRVRYEIEEIEKGRTYLIRFTSIAGTSGTFMGFLNLKTNYQEKPLLNIRIRANLRQGKTSQGR